MKYELRFFFEWGDDSASIWCGNQAARDRFDVGPIVFDELGLSEALQQLLRELGDEYQTSLNWDYPPDPSPWTQEQKESFLRRSEAAYQQLVMELGDEYIVYNCVDLPD